VDGNDLSINLNPRTPALSSEGRGSDTACRRTVVRYNSCASEEFSHSSRFPLLFATTARGQRPCACPCGRNPSPPSHSPGRQITRIHVYLASSRAAAMTRSCDSSRAILAVPCPAGPNVHYRATGGCWSGAWSCDHYNSHRATALNSAMVYLPVDHRFPRCLAPMLAGQLARI